MNERILNAISDAELERRWAAVRAQMAQRKIDALVMQNNNDWLGGTVKWFTDLPATNGYPKSVIFHATDFMTVVEMGPHGARRKLDGADPVQRGVGAVISTAAFTSIAYTDDYQARIVAEELIRRGYRTVGWIGRGAIPHQFVTHVEAALEGQTKFVDATEFVDRIKAIKSAEEIAFVRRAAEMQDQIFARVLRQIRPGMRDTEITALAQYEGRLLDSEQGLFLGTSAPLGQRSGFMDRHLQGRTLKAGEHFTLLIENNGPCGFYAEIARTVVLGKASNELIDGFEAMKEAQAHTLSLIKPAAACRDIAAAHDDFMRACGLPPERRLYCHGQGYDLVERPLVRADETMTLEENMNLAVHPGYETDSLFAVICDNYLVGATGPSDCLHKTAKQVFEI
ncbi:MAG: M24 family metallopeptidase [Xanthobacteraceae bacterium]